MSSLTSIVSKGRSPSYGLSLVSLEYSPPYLFTYIYITYFYAIYKYWYMWDSVHHLLLYH